MTEINKKLDLAMVPPTNNDGDPYILPLDIYKEGYGGYNISNWFKGRVGDNGTPFAIRWYSHGRLLNIQGMRPFIEGQVGDYSIDDSDPDNIRIDMAEDASNIHIVGDVDDTQAGGVAIYRLINQAFPKSGIFYGKIGFMGTQDDGTLVNTGVDIVFKVLAGHMNMLGARKFYVSELEKAGLEMQAKFKQYDQEYKDTTTKQAEQFMTDTEKALADLNTKIANEIKRAEDTLGDTQASIDSNIASLKRIAVTCGSIQAQIDANDIVKIKDFNDQTKALAEGQKNLNSAINSKLSTLSAQPELFDNLDAIKIKYPNGTDGIKIATDTWHGYGFIDKNWKDLGDYKQAAIDPIKFPANVEAHLSNGLQISWKNLGQGSIGFNVPASIMLSGTTNTEIKLTDLQAAAENSELITYQNSLFCGTNFLAVYQPNISKPVFKNPGQILASDIPLFGNSYASWIGGLLIDDANNKLIRNNERLIKGRLYGVTNLTLKDSSLKLDFSISLYGSGMSVDLDNSKIVSDVKSYLSDNKLNTVSFKDETISGDNYLLVYNWEENKCKVYANALQPLNSQETALFGNYFASYSGLVYDCFQRNFIHDKVSINSFSPKYEGLIYGPNQLQFTEHTLPLNFNITIYGSHNYVDLSATKMQNDIENTITPTENFKYENKTITSDQFTLYYDFRDNKTHLVNNGLYSLNDDQVNIFSNYYTRLNGIAFDYYLRLRFQKASIAEDQTYTDPITGFSYPYYFHDNLTNAIHKVRDNMAKVGDDGLTFLWITDVHWESNNKHSPALVKEMMAQTQIPYMVGGGDFFNLNDSKDGALQCLNDAISAYKIPGVDFPNVLGNHDNNSVANKSDLFLSKKEMASALYNLNPTNDNFKLLNYPTDLSWQVNWVNNALTSSKYNFTGYGIDTGVCTGATLAQVQNLIKLCKEKRNIVVFAHCMLSDGEWQPWTDDFNLIVDAINTNKPSITTNYFGTLNLTGVQGHIIAIICGHEHQDNLRYTDNGTPCIVTDCDCGPETYKNQQYPYVPNTITEQCFSVFTVDFVNKKIYEIRVGRGKDRSFDFK